MCAERFMSCKARAHVWNKTYIKLMAFVVHKSRAIECRKDWRGKTEETLWTFYDPHFDIAVLCFEASSTKSLLFVINWIDPQTMRAAVRLEIELMHKKRDEKLCGDVNRLGLKNLWELHSRFNDSQSMANCRDVIVEILEPIANNRRD